MTRALIDVFVSPYERASDMSVPAGLRLSYVLPYTVASARLITANAGA